MSWRRTDAMPPEGSHGIELHPDDKPLPAHMQEELLRDDTGEFVGGMTQFYEDGPIYGYSRYERTGPMSCSIEATLHLVAPGARGIL